MSFFLFFFSFFVVVDFFGSCLFPSTSIVDENKNKCKDETNEFKCTNITWNAVECDGLREWKLTPYIVCTVYTSLSIIQLKMFCWFWVGDNIMTGIWMKWNGRDPSTHRHHHFRWWTIVCCAFMCFSSLEIDRIWIWNCGISWHSFDGRMDVPKTICSVTGVMAVVIVVVVVDVGEIQMSLSLSYAVVVVVEKIKVFAFYIFFYVFETNYVTRRAHGTRKTEHTHQRQLQWNTKSYYIL